MPLAPAKPSYSSGTSDSPLLGDTIGGNLARTVEAFGDRDALVDCATGRRWTYHQLADDVDVIAIGLAARGIGKGDRVGIWSPNRAEWTLVQYATAPSKQSLPSGAHRSTAYRPCSSPSWPTPPLSSTTCPACAPASWPAPRARSRS